MGGHPAAAVREPSPSGPPVWRPVPLAVLAVSLGTLAGLGIDALLRRWLGDGHSAVERWACAALGLLLLVAVVRLAWGRDGVGWSVGARDPTQRARHAASAASWLSLLASLFWLNACPTAYFWARSATDPRPWAILMGGLGLLASALAVRSCLEPDRARPTAVGALALCAGFNAIPAIVVAGAILKAPSVAGGVVALVVFVPSGLCLLAARRVARAAWPQTSSSSG